MFNILIFKINKIKSNIMKSNNIFINIVFLINLKVKRKTFFFGYYLKTLYS